MTVSNVKKLRFELLRASNLPKRSIGFGGYFATITTGTGWKEDTSIEKKASPEWKQTFICEVSEADPILSIKIFRLQKSSNKDPELVAKASVNVASCLTSPLEKIFERHHGLVSPDSARWKLKKANIYYSCMLDHDGVTTVNPNSDPTALAEMVKQGRDSSKLATPTVAGHITGAVSFLGPLDVTQCVMEILKKVKQIGDSIAEVHPYAKLVWSVLSSAQMIVVSQMTRDVKVRDLWGTVSEALDLAQQAEGLRNKPIYRTKVEELLQQIYECVLFLRCYEEKGFGARIFRDSLSTNSEDAITRFQKAFCDLLKSFQDRVSLDQVIQTYRLVDLAQRTVDIAQDQRLDELPGAKLSSVECDPKRGCLSGTRIKLLEDIYAWIHSLNGDKDERILWLYGPAGTGKSSVANSVAAGMDSLGRLAASFRFDRNDAARTPDVLIGNICRQVARFNVSLQASVAAAIHRYGPGSALACTSQAKKLLVDPVRSVELVGPIVIVIDALDESGRDDDSGGGITRMDLVRTITEDLIHLPPSVKLLVTSREEGCIPGLMSACISCKPVRITDAKDTEEDIKRYIESRMDQIRRFQHRVASWPGEDQVQKLVRYSDGLFICAAVACSFIEKGQPGIRLEMVLDSSSCIGLQPEENLDKLYQAVLRQSLPGNDLERDFWQLVLGTIVALKKPLTITSMDALLGLSAKQTTGDIVSSLKPVLMIDTEMKEEVRLLHKSVLDFLTVRAEGSIYVDIHSHSGNLANPCLTYMNQNLCYNMKWVTTALGPNSSSDTSDKTMLCNPSALQYACLYFAEHLADLHLESCDQILAACEQTLGTFLNEHLLHWLEFMAHLGEMHVVEVSLRTLTSWLEICGLSSPLHQATGDGSKSKNWLSIISDTMVFLQNFHSMATSSPMDIYHSAIPMSPHTSTLYKIYNSCIPCLPIVTSSHPLWTRSLQVFEGHHGVVTSVAFSTDGKKLASGSYDYTVRLWDTEKGEAIGLALAGHHDAVVSVAFSSDGKKLASGSDDYTVRLWDAEKGEAIGPALEGHSDRVTSVVFSSDGKKMASGSYDCTVQLWDVEKGEAIGLALKGHSGKVTSVVFSSDGKKLASGSNDNTVQLWDVVKGDAIRPALKGHVRIVTTVVFSNDGKKLASGSYDNTVRLWDVEKREAIGPALEGHSDAVVSVVFSSDGTKLASGSDDHTVRLWDVEKGEVIGLVLEGHTREVTSVVFSSDGKKLASGSYDYTVRLWDVEKGEAIGPALEGHIGEVTSVVFSNDGKRLASGSHDYMVRLWDVEKGKVIGPALKGHTKEVTSIAFSSDGKKLASGSCDHTVQLWNVEKGEPIGIALKGHTKEVTSVVFSSDRKMLASGSDDCTVQLWDVEKRKAIGSALKGHTREVASVVFSTDGRKLASGSYDNTVRLWDVEKEKAIGLALKGHTEAVTSVVFSNDGKKLASGSDDHTVWLWDVERGEAIGVLKGHTSFVSSVMFYDDGKKLASRSVDGAVWHWDVEKRVKINGHTDIITSHLHDFWLAPSHPIKDSADIEISRTPAPKLFLKFDHFGFIRNGDNSQLIWIPAHLRGFDIAVHECTQTIAIAGINGPVTIIRNLKRPCGI